MFETIGFIFARGGSKGLRNKNILDFAGKPLISWTIKQALENPRIKRIIVSTDSEEIADVSLTFGAEVPFLRPLVLASDTSPELDSWKHALNFLQESEGKIPDIFLSLPCTAPLRSQSDIENILDCLIKNKADLAISISPSHRSPFFNMVQMDSTGKVSLVIESERSYARRQDTPLTFDVTTIAYCARSEFILETENLMEGKVFGSIVERERAIDIDNQLDFDLAQFLFSRNRATK